MTLIKDSTIKVFDLTAIHRGDAVRIRQSGDAVYRNGQITKITEAQAEVLYSNIQDESTSYVQILAADVATGAWEMYWTTDFVTINYQPGGDLDA